MRDSIAPAALICSVLANVNRDPDRRPEPYTPSDFMPGARSAEDDMREFAEACARGDKFEISPEEALAFRRQLQTAFGNVKTPK